MAPCFISIGDVNGCSLFVLREEENFAHMDCMVIAGKGYCIANLTGTVKSYAQIRLQTLAE